MDNQLIYTGQDLSGNWFYNQYYYAGSNSRYMTFQLVLNLLNQRHQSPTILETGCQRLVEDLGGGMSTSIWAEYIHRYGGKLISVDLSLDNLLTTQKILTKYADMDVTFVHSDSVQYLQKHSGMCDLLYLDSFDYPYGDLLNLYGGREAKNAAIALLASLTRQEIVNRHLDIILPCQQHCLNEFQAIEKRLPNNCILLIDDNQLPGGGKSRLLKEYLEIKPDWICLLDFQGSVWIKEL